MKIRISRLALGDVAEIHAYTLEHWGEEQASRYVNQIWEDFDRIVASPERWRLRENVHPGCRICFSGRHAILYRLHKSRVEIARVLHGSMDLRRHIPPGFFQEDDRT